MNQFLRQVVNNKFDELETVNLTNSDRESLHIPGSIQPHGLLRVLTEPDARPIARVRQNILKILGIALTHWLDRLSLAELTHARSETGFLRQYLVAKPTSFQRNPVSLRKSYLANLIGGDCLNAIHACLNRSLEPIYLFSVTLTLEESESPFFNGIVHRLFRRASRCCKSLCRGEKLLELKPLFPSASNVYKALPAKISQLVIKQISDFYKIYFKAITLCKENLIKLLIIYLKNIGSKEIKKCNSVVKYNRVWERKLAKYRVVFSKQNLRSRGQKPGFFVDLSNRNRRVFRKTRFLCVSPTKTYLKIPVSAGITQYNLVEVRLVAKDWFHLTILPNYAKLTA